MLRAENLHKRFDKTVALSGVSLDVPDSCVFGLVGSNGSGKSTLLRLLCGVLRPNEGTVTMDGQAVYEHASVKQQIAYVSDDPYTPSGATPRRMEAFYRRVYTTFDSARYAELIDRFRLPPDAEIEKFSRGMRRLAAVAAALAVRPRWLLMDETMDGLDPVMRHMIKGVIGEDIANRGTTAICVSHSMRELEGMCDRLALLHEGQLVLHSDVLDLKTSLYKVQIALDRSFTREEFAGLSVIDYQQQASVATMILEGDRAVIDAILRAKEPLLLEVLPLTLEEVFLFEMRARNYDYTALLGGDDA